jgi:hypothetical protein
MSAVIKETYGARFAEVFFKTYIRTLLKYAAADVAAVGIGIETGKQTNSQAGVLAAIAIAVTARKAMEATEAADIRMSRYLPSRAYVGGINLDPGTYDVTVNFYSGRNIVSSVEHKDVNVRARGLNLIQAVSLN